MCEFCTEHGEGRQWYLAAENYAHELFEKDGRREYMVDFLNHFPEHNGNTFQQLDMLKRLPLQPLVRSVLHTRSKASHYGQVVPLEDVERILLMVGGAVRLPCVCRQVTTGNMNARYCYGLNFDARLHAALDNSLGLEILSAEEAIASMRAHDQEGLVHSVWTFKTPYIGGICNCDQDCMAYRINHARADFQIMFRAEYIAKVNLENCNGCKVCIRQCQYGAMRYSAVNKKVLVDPTACYGCGVCRAACHHDAIMLAPRREDPVAARIW
jgi:ferredoxin